MNVTLEIGGTHIVDPDWQQIQEMIFQMKGGTSDPLKLIIPGRGSLVVGGGEKQRYMVVFFPELHPDLPSLTLIDPSLGGSDVRLNIGGPIRLPARYAVTSALVLYVLEFFIRTGQIPSDIHWEDDRTKEEAVNAGRGEREGEQWGVYHLEHLLGHSSGAEVYLAQSVQQPDRVAVKILTTPLSKERDVELFRKDMQAISLLHHPHVLPIIDFGIQAQVPFLVMNFLPWGSLRYRYFKQIVPLPSILPYVKQIAGALDYAHQQKRIHGKVKPENMLLVKGNNVQLSDFEITSITTSLPLQERRGDIPYLAPEQIQGQLLPASDQYALGVVVYEWLCGIQPFQGTASEVMQQHLFEAPIPPRKRVRKIHADVEKVVLQALEKNPLRRFPSVLAFAEALDVAK